MSQDLAFDFVVDKAAKTVVITREFAAELPLVWDAFTKPEILEKWIAPKPWTCKIKYLDFKVGGKHFYAMVSPTGEERWSIQEYTSILVHHKIYILCYQVLGDYLDNALCGKVSMLDILHYSSYFW